MRWPASLNKKIKTKTDLAAYTSFKISALAKYFFEPKSLKDLRLALISARRAGERVFVLGGGSNILVASASLNGLVVRLSSPAFRNCAVSGGSIEAGSGVKLNNLILFAKKNNLSGLEFLTGIPGTFGGCLMGNAGAWGRAIGELVQAVGVLDYQGRLKILSNQQLKFAYRKSNLGKYIILFAKLNLSGAPKKMIAAKIKEFLLRRKKSQSHNLPNAGCVFKNPPGACAGRLIDLCGLKGACRGQAVISLQHANFILNKGNARSKDVLGLMELARQKVKEKFKVNLKAEIKIWR